MKLSVDEGEAVVLDKLVVWEGRRYRVMVRYTGYATQKDLPWWRVLLGVAPATTGPHGYIRVQRLDNDANGADSRCTPDVECLVTEIATRAEEVVDAVRLLESVAPEPAK